MKLLDELDGTQYSIGDIIKDDFGTEWFILGFSSQGWVQVIENDKLNEVATIHRLGTLALKVEV